MKKTILGYWILVIGYWLLSTMPVNAQKLTIEKTTIDVGRTGYQQPITAVFEFRVKGSKKVRIKEVRPDCNCTKVEYPKTDQGDKFQIRMTYDARQLGHFDKQAAIVTNATSKPFYIRMKGIVLREYQDLSKNYPITMGNLLLDHSDLEFDDINRGDQQVQVIHIYNGDTKVAQPNLMHLPPYLTATMVPERLGPGRAGTMTVTLNSNQLHDYGLTQSAVYLAENPGDTVSADHEIGVSAVLLPSFMGMTTAQKQYAPKMLLSKTTVDILFNGKSKKRDIIEITNKGRTELDISSLQLFTGGLKVSLGKSKLQPGEKTTLKITAMRDELKKVRTRPRILMITNDPDKPKVTITINAK
jgi:hypothetical protein